MKLSDQMHKGFIRQNDSSNMLDENNVANKLNDKFISEIWLEKNGVFSWKTVDKIMQKPNGINIISAIFHSEKPDIKFKVQDQDGALEEISCQRSLERSCMTSDCKASLVQNASKGKSGDVFDINKHDFETIGGSQKYIDAFIRSKKDLCKV
jgi:hypothetical protein